MSVARPYARALFAAAADRSETVLADLDRAAELLARNPDLAAFLNHPGVAGGPKREVLGDALRADVDELTLHFLLLLVDRRRLGAFADILRAYRALVEEAQGTGRGVIESSRPLGPREVAALERAVSAWAGRRVSLVADVRPELLGGARVILGDRVVDGSMAGRLQQLGRRLKQ